MPSHSSSLSCATLKEEPTSTIVVETDPFGRNTETYYQCGSDKSVIFLGTLAGLNIAVLLFAIIQCWHARNVSTELSESQYIFCAVCFIIMAVSP